MAVTKPKKKIPTKKQRAQIPDKDNPYHGCGPGKIRDPGTGQCISHTAYNKKYGSGGTKAASAKKRKKPSNDGFRYG